MSSEESPKKSFLTESRNFIRKEFLPVLTDLRLAIILLLIIAAFSITGTVIEQG
ncbi:MAG: cytochrome c biogenesis protein, partial [Cyanobacteria bacterium J06649_11]